MKRKFVLKSTRFFLKELVHVSTAIDIDFLTPNPIPGRSSGDKD